MSDNSRFPMVSKEDTSRLLNHTALRDMQIRAYWEGMSHAKIKRKDMIEIICERFNTGHKNVEKIVKYNGAES